MATTMTPLPAAASTDSLASSSGSGSGSGSNSKESRFNRLIHRLHGSGSSRDMAGMELDGPSTPLRYAPRTGHHHARSASLAARNNGSNSPALSDIDDIPLERPVFESNFMRELQQGQQQSSSSSPRPLLAPSYSSPAAVITHRRPSPNNNNTNVNSSQQHVSPVFPSRELERTRSSPIATSPSTTNSSGSLKARLVRVASSNSLFGKNSNATSIAAGNDDQQQVSPSHPQLGAHRKTASLVSSSSPASGPSPSPRSRLAASVANTAQQQQSPSTAMSSSTFSKSHAYRHSEDVRQYSRSSPALEVPSSAYGKNHASSPPLSSSPSSSARAPSPNLHALREQADEDGQPSSSSRHNGSLFSGLSTSSFSLSRKRSTDGLSLASNLSSHHLPIPEDEEGQQDGEPERGVPSENDENVDEDQTAKRNSASSIEQKQSSKTAAVHGDVSSRPPLGERYLSSDRLPSQDTTATATANYKSTTPGFPRHIPNAFYSSTHTNPSSSSTYTSSTATDGTLTTGGTSTIQSQRTGLISSGLSESSRRFRSAFRLNKSRAAGMATPGAAAAANSNEAAASLMGASTTTRRAMRVPLRQQLCNEDEDEEAQTLDDASVAASMSVGNSSASPKQVEEGTSDAKSRSPTLTKTPDEVISHDFARDDNHPTPPTGPNISHTLPHDSGNASRSRSNSPRSSDLLLNHDEEYEDREKERESARERAQLVLPPSSTASSHNTSSNGPHKITVARPVKTHALGEGMSLGALRPGRAIRGEQQDMEQGAKSSPDAGRSANVGNPHASQARHARTASHGRPEDLVMAQEAGNLAHARPASRQQNHPPVPPPHASSQHHARNPSDSTLVATAQTGLTDAHREEGWQVQPQQRDVPHAHQTNTRDRSAPRSQQPEQEEVLLIDGDKENAGAGDWYRQHREKRDEKDSEKGHLPALADRQAGENGVKPRQILGQVRKPLQEQQGNHQQPQQRAEGGFLPEPRQQGPLPQQHRIGSKLSSSSSNGGLGYFPSDRQVIVNDYAVPTKRSGDTPPSSNEKEYNHHQPFPSSQQQQHPEINGQHPYPQQQQAHSRPAAPPFSRPPAASLPALPSLPPHAHDQQVALQANAPVQKRAPGTVTVQGKTYTRMGLLGRGGSSKVFRVCDKDHLVYALKKIDLGRGADSETYQAFLNEISLLEALRGHDRIIQLVAHEVNEVKKSLIMVMEIGEIDLNALLQERISKSFPSSMNFIRYMWEQMLEAVNVIHDEGIVHTDLKPANFVLVKGALKLIDFGIAKAIPNDTTNIARDQQIGTANYMSPEALNPHNSAKNGRVMKLGRPSDVWSLGCILYQMVYGHTPFGQIKNLAAKMNAIQTPGYAINFPTHAVPSTIKGEPLPELAVRVEDDLLAVMKSCLRYESKRRATIPELLMDPFLRREDSGRERDGEDSPSKNNSTGEQTVTLDVVSAIVKQTLNWSNGRAPTRGEQERFVEAILRQANGMIR